MKTIWLKMMQSMTHWLMTIISLVIVKMMTLVGGTLVIFHKQD